MFVIQTDATPEEVSDLAVQLQKVQPQLLFLASERLFVCENAQEVQHLLSALNKANARVKELEAAAVLPS